MVFKILISKKKGTIEIEDKIKKYAVHLVIQFLKRTILWPIVFTESLWQRLSASVGVHFKLAIVVFILITKSRYYWYRRSYCISRDDLIWKISSHSSVWKFQHKTWSLTIMSNVLSNWVRTRTNKSQVYFPTP